MRLALLPHPGHPAPAIRVEAEAERAANGRLALRYRIAGAISGLLLPAPAAPGRADALWRHSCFEAFVRPAASADYWEFNFAPSGQWAAYRFSGYRRDMAAAEEMPPPEMEMLSAASRVELAATIGLEQLAGLAWQVGLSAVIEERSGRKSWWALAHPPGEPDFHHEDCFALQLPPAACSDEIRHRPPAR
jgi:hypothetical protein